MTATAQTRIVSPEVHADRTITFRFRAPNAKKVEVGLEGKANIAMTKDANGVWSATTPAVEPDIYGYGFSVDGVGALDPLNTQMKPNMIWPGNLVTVPGNQIWEPRAVPHGTVNRHFYDSKAASDYRDYYVYTPPGYATGKGKLPVLYLLHGFSDTSAGWSEVGKAHVILDNLIAEKKIKSFIVVMPLGYGVPDLAVPGGGFPARDRLMESFANYRKSVLTEVIPMVERDYRASSKREDRAIAGLSMGGAQTLWIGLHNPTLFGHLGAFSTGGLQSGAADTDFAGLNVPEIKKFKTFWMACGTEDSLILFQRNFVKWLEAKDIAVESKETPGGHQWMLWRRNLAEFAQMIFK